MLRNVPWVQCAGGRVVRTGALGTVVPIYWDSIGQRKERLYTAVRTGSARPYPSPCRLLECLFDMTLFHMSLLVRACGYSLCVYAINGDFPFPWFFGFRSTAGFVFIL